MKKKTGLCFRCDHRAEYLEDRARNGEQHAHAPRAECGDPLVWVSSCYMYRPIRPLRLKKNEGDNRPQFSGFALSARSHAVDIPDMILDASKTKKGIILYWKPKRTK